MLDHAVALRCAASARLAFFGVRRASEIAGLRMADIVVDEAGGLVEVKVRSQKNDQFGAGQVARVVALPSWGGRVPSPLGNRVAVVQSLVGSQPRSRRQAGSAGRQ